MKSTEQQVQLQRWPQTVRRRKDEKRAEKKRSVEKRREAWRKEEKRAEKKRAEKKRKMHNNNHNQTMNIVTFYVP